MAPSFCLAPYGAHGSKPNFVMNVSALNDRWWVPALGDSGVFVLDRSGKAFPEYCECLITSRGENVVSTPYTRTVEQGGPLGSRAVLASRAGGIATDVGSVKLTEEHCRNVPSPSTCQCLTQTPSWLASNGRHIKLVQL